MLPPTNIILGRKGLPGTRHSSLSKTLVNCGLKSIITMGVKVNQRIRFPLNADNFPLVSAGGSFGGQNLQPDSREGGRDTGVGRSSSI